MKLAAALLTLSFATAAHAQDYPKRPVTMIVPFAAGGTSDVIARVVAEEMAKSLGQPIVIENIAGAGGSIALARAARAEADGYTIAIGNAGTSAATYTIYPKLPFTPDSFVPIAMVAKTFGIVALRKDFPAKNLQEFIAYAKKNPGKINLGHAGVGSSNFLICKSFVQAAGIDVTLVGYRGAAPALTDAIGGQIDGVCDAAASVSQAIDDKLVKAIVVGSTVRLATLPELPTSAEAGLPEFEAQGWNGLFAPKGTPPAIVAKLNAAAKSAVESDAVKKRFHDLSTVAPDANEHTPEVLQQLVTRDVEKYRKLLEEKVTLSNTRISRLPAGPKLLHSTLSLIAEFRSSDWRCSCTFASASRSVSARSRCLLPRHQPAMAETDAAHCDDGVRYPHRNRTAEQRLRGHALHRLSDLRRVWCCGI